MRRQHMLKSNLEPKNKILNIYLNCQLKSNEPVLQYHPVSSHIFIKNSNRTLSKCWSEKEGYWRLWAEWFIWNIICDTLHFVQINVILFNIIRQEITLPEKIFLSFTFPNPMLYVLCCNLYTCTVQCSPVYTSSSLHPASIVWTQSHGLLSEKPEISLHSVSSLENINFDLKAKRLCTHTSVYLIKCSFSNITIVKIFCESY